MSDYVVGNVPVLNGTNKEQKRSGSISIYQSINPSSLPKDKVTFLDFLDLNQADFGRYRDAWVDLDKKEIEVYTRCGGGNREDYQEVFETMLKHPLYIRDEDNEEDYTYCSFYFKFPATEKFLKFIERLTQ